MAFVRFLDGSGEHIPRADVLWSCRSVLKDNRRTLSRKNNFFRALREARSERSLTENSTKEDENQKPLLWKPSETRNKKSYMLNCLSQFQEINPYGSDIILSLLYSAANSHLYSESIYPFPPMCMKKNDPDIDSLLETLQSALNFFLQIWPLLDCLNEKSIELLYWIFYGSSVTILVKDEPQVWMTEKDLPTPTLVFRTIHTGDMPESPPLFYGTRLEKFFRVLTTPPSPGKLSPNLAKMLSKSTFGYTCGASQLGHRMRCVAVYRGVDNPRLEYVLVYVDENAMRSRRWMMPLLSAVSFACLFFALPRCDGIFP